MSNWDDSVYRFSVIEQFLIIYCEKVIAFEKGKIQSYLLITYHDPYV